MPYAELKGIRLYYEAYGEGPPLVMIMGLGGDVNWWPPKLIDLLSSEFKVIIFDNRGAGRSEKPYGKYSIRLMAEDTVGLMDYLGIDRANILGVSMGGMIAQEIALTYPERVLKLVLVSTAPGGGCSIPPTGEALEQLLLDRDKTPPEIIARKTIETLFSEEWLRKNREVIDELIERVTRTPIPGYAYNRQLEAIAGFESCSRLSRIKHETLVIGGGRDIILPVENSQVLASMIPNAKLVVFEDAGHGLILEKLDEFATKVIKFLKDK